MSSPDLHISTPTSVAGTLTLTSYRVFFCGKIKEKVAVDQIPLGLIHKVSKVGGQKRAKEKSYRLDISSKDGKTLRLIMPRSGGVRKEVYKRLKERVIDYCYTYHSQTHANTHSASSSASGVGVEDPGWGIFSVEEENARMGVGSEWRVYVNTEGAHSLCATYPSKITVPAAATEKMLQAVAGYRTKQRLPALSYRHWRTPATITRASQPKPGVSRTRCTEDEMYVQLIRQASTARDAQNGTPDHPTNMPPLYIIDARPYANAVGNMAKGAGWELVDNYESCKIEFCGIANIHVMRDSLNRLREACYESDAGWYKALEQSGWYNHISLLLAGAVRIARLIDGGTPVLVHCSDGWDRTAQLISLAVVMLDPYYRTLEGIAKLIEREWLQMGHQFALRCGHDDGKEDQRSPVFFQFLESLYQFVSQHPNAFEYNAKLLQLLNHHSFACLFGTFLANCERKRADVRGKTRSIWSYITANSLEYKNPQYQPLHNVLLPESSVKMMQLWKEEYFTPMSYA